MNVVVLIYTDDDSLRLREYLEKEDCTIISQYSRADWHNQAKGRPRQAFILRINNKKKEFEVRMKFDTFPRKGVEF